MNLPNKLTVIRIILVPFFVSFLLSNSIPHHYLAALIIFLAASITDHYDGKIARQRSLITDFGKFADPLADKILVMSAFLCFMQLDLIGATAIILILMREFTITSIRLVAASGGKVISANIWGKAKTVSQMIAVIIVLILQYINELLGMGFNVFGLNNASGDISYIFYVIGVILIWISAVLTLISGVIYIKDNKEIINTAK